jgi:peptide/nickel transport system substrate-binding protein
VLALFVASCGQAAPVPEEEPAEAPVEEVVEETAVEEAAEEAAVEEAPGEEVAEEAMAEVEAGCGFDVVIGSNGDGKIVNPILAVDTDGFWRTDMMFDSLVDLDLDTLEPVPHLAKSWEVSDDGTAFTFTLTDADVRWHDGEPFTVADIEYSLLEILKPTYTGIYQQRFQELVGADKVIAGEATSLEGFKIIDDKTVQFSLNQVDPAFLAVAINNLKFLPKHLLEGQEITEDMPYSQAPIGTGPYKFKEWEKGSRFVMEWNLDYWGEKPCPKTITTVVIPDMQAIAAAVEAGDIDMTIMVPPTEVPRLAQVSELAVYQQPSVGPETLWFNLEHPILSDPLVRRAIAHAIDTEAFTEGVLQGTTSPANSIFSNASWAYDASSSGVEYDPEKAKEFLAEAGYPDGFKIQLSTNQGNFFRELFVEFAQAELAKVGIEVELNKAEWGTFIGSVQEGTYEMRFHNQDSGVPDPNVVFPVYSTGGPNNWNSYSNPEVDELLNQAASTTDLEIRKEAYNQLAAIVSEDMPNFPAFWRPNPMVTNAKFDNVKPSVIHAYGAIHKWRLKE